MTTGQPPPTIPDRVIDALGDAIRDRGGDLLPPVVEGLTTQLEATDQLLRPAEVGGRYATVYDLDRTPQPAWVGAATGTTVPGGLTVAEQRAYVRDRPAQRRGTLDAIAAAVRTLLTGRRHVGFLERGRHLGDADRPWRLVIRVLDSETTATADQLAAAAATQKPVGLIIEGVEIIAGITYGELGDVFGSYGDLADAYPTLGDLDDLAEDLAADDQRIYRWHRGSHATRVQRFARTLAQAPTFTDRLALYPTFRDARDALAD